jgi:hypothetical protein
MKTTDEKFTRQFGADMYLAQSLLAFGMSKDDITHRINAHTNNKSSRIQGDALSKMSNTNIHDAISRKTCHLCGGTMIHIDLFKGRKAIYCKKDRVTIPLPYMEE